MARPHRTPGIVMALAGALVVAVGCSTTHHAATTAVPPVAVDDSSNGTTIPVRVGQALTVTLHSTYWQLRPPTNAAVLAVRAGPVARPGAACPRIPGTGCGTVTAQYRAARAGVTELDAQRDSCGEALRCVGAQGRWSIEIRVAASG